MSNNIDLDSLNLTQAQILDTENGASDDSSGASPRMEEEVQNDFMFAELRAEELRRAQDQRYRHTEEEHDLRKKHLGFLSKITIYWLGLITAVSWLQGFKGPFMVNIHIKSEYLEKMPIYFSVSSFELTNPAFIALITTTTATILGLYTIAAIWLYKGKQEDKKQKADTGNSSNEEI
ncbi:hypothetical protein [Acinetobacter ursingii]|uniref:hypothetical protein n=1 Tax=Acinetobacter ursingii TaxID=108980 RepID=UPI00124F8386|nr:hypothetical protein [Acinetobacter ursingii]